LRREIVEARPRAVETIASAESGSGRRYWWHIKTYILRRRYREADIVCQV